MNSGPLSPHDPKLTAYALGELDFEENARLAEAIEGDAAAQAAVEDIRLLAGHLEGALENEPMLPEPSVGARVLSSDPAPAATQLPEKLVHFPALWILGLAAACVMIVLASLPPAPTSTAADRSLKTQAKVLPGAQPAAVTPSPLPDAGFIQPVLPIVESRKRPLSAEMSDVKPAPLRDDGLDLWRSLVDLGGSWTSPTAMSGFDQPAPSVEPKTYQKTYQLADYTNRAGNKELGVPSDVSRPGADADHAVTAHYEVVPISTSEVATIEEPSRSSDASDTPLLATDNPGHRELLTLKISYRLSAVDLAPHIELPRIDPVVALALTDKDFKLAVAAAGLGKKLKETPPKRLKPYDAILSWPEEKPDSLVNTTKPGDETLDTTKRTVE